MLTFLLKRSESCCLTSIEMLDWYRCLNIFLATVSLCLMVMMLLKILSSLKYSPFKVGSHDLFLSSWTEYGFSLQQAGQVEVWVCFEYIPFTYWSVDGLCLIGSAIGKPMAFNEEA